MIISISGKIGSGKDTAAQMVQYITHPEKEMYEDFEDFKVCFNDHNDVWQIRKFADKLKDMVCLMIGCTREQLEDRDFKNKELGEEWWYYSYTKHGINPYRKETADQGRKLFGEPVKLTPRTILQLLGTECGRDIIHPNCWVNALFSDYVDRYIGNWGQGNHIYKKPNWIITDTRFENEYRAIKQRGGVTIKIKRDTELRYPDLWKQFQESEYDEWNAWLKLVNKFNTVYHPSETGLDHITDWDYVIENNGTLEELGKKVKVIVDDLKLTEQSAE